MKRSSHVALFNVLALLLLCAVAVAAAGGMNADPSTLWSLGMLTAALILVYWRVDRAYSAGQVPFSRAVAEGFVSGACLAVAVQVCYWAGPVVAGYSALGSVTDAAGVVNLLQQASYAGALGAIIGIILWAANAAVFKRTVL